MTKKKTTKRVSNSNRLSPSYKFCRALRDDPAVTALFKDRNDRINRVSPVKDILVIDTYFSTVKAVDVEKNIDGTDTYSTFPITKHQKEWPFRVEYVEQLLEVDNIWVVIVEPYYQDPSTGPLSISNISIDVTHIRNPIVVCCESSIFDINQYPPLRTEKELLTLEKEMGFGKHPTGSTFVCGENAKTLEIAHCNILPYNLRIYNATFYHREVAQLYVDSLSAHLGRYNGS